MTVLFDELVAKVGPQRYREACERAWATAAGTGRCGGARTFPGDLQGIALHDFHRELRRRGAVHAGSAFDPFGDPGPQGAALLARLDLPDTPDLPALRARLALR